MELTVKSFAHAKIIAKALANSNIVAANEYLEKYSLRHTVEAAARSSLYLGR